MDKANQDRFYKDNCLTESYSVVTGFPFLPGFVCIYAYLMVWVFKHFEHLSCGKAWDNTSVIHVSVGVMAEL